MKPSFAAVLKFDEEKHPRDKEGQFTGKKHVEEMVKSYGLTLQKIKRDEDGMWTVTVQGGRPEIEHLARDTE